MNKQELEEYVDKHRNALIAEATTCMDEEDGRWTYWGDIAMCIYYETWVDGNDIPYYHIAAFPLKEDRHGMMVEDMDFFVPVAEIKTRGIEE